MIDYRKSKIYKIKCHTTDMDFLFFTTRRSPSSRICNLRMRYHDYICGVHSNHAPIFDIFKNNNYSIELIEPYPCNYKHEVEQRISEINKNIFLSNKNKTMNDEQPRRTRYEIIVDIHSIVIKLGYPKLKYLHSMSKKQLVELHTNLSKEYKTKIEFYSQLNNK